jgi:hypothetical protein
MASAAHNGGGARRARRRGAHSRAPIAGDVAAVADQPPASRRAGRVGPAVRLPAAHGAGAGPSSSRSSSPAAAPLHARERAGGRHRQDRRTAAAGPPVAGPGRVDGATWDAIAATGLDPRGARSVRRQAALAAPALG